MEDPSEKKAAQNLTELDEVAAPLAFQIPNLQGNLSSQKKDKSEAKGPNPEPGLPVLVPGIRYDGMEEFARGGLGRILRAKDNRLGRPVAIKELLRNRGSAELRFLREAYLTARLEHPSIVPVHDTGRWENGAPFFTMKLVSGRTLKEALDNTHNLTQRLALLPHLIDTCEAMAYSHSQRIIHRDLKPHNILVGEFGETVVIDWGLAKELGESWERASRLAGSDNTPEDHDVEPEEPPKKDAASQSLTRVGAVMGTPAYMPPEQAAGEVVDERADVYALGAILYYFLTGSPPYKGESGQDIVNQVLLQSPPPVLTLQPDAPKDLAAITAKAMDRDLRTRYRTAKELANDLRNYQLGGLVGAHKYTISELVSRWVKKNKLTVTVSSALILFMVLGGVFSVYSIIDAKNIAEVALAEEETQRREAEKQSLIAKEKQQLAEEHSNDLHLLQARSALDADPAATLAWLKEMFPHARGWSYARLLAQETLRRGAARYVFRGHQGRVNGMAFSPDGKLLASASKDGTVRLWNLEAKKDTVLYVSAKDSLTPQEIIAVAFSSDGQFIAAADTSGVVGLWKTSEISKGSAEATRLEGHSSSINAMAFSPDGKWLATASDDTLLILWAIRGAGVSTGTRRPLGSQMSPIKNIAFEPSGKTLASTAQDGTVYLWDLETSMSTPLKGSAKPGLPLRFLANEDKLVGANDAGLLIWSLADKEAAPLLLSIDGLTPKNIEVSSDGKWLAVSGDDGQVHRWSFAQKQWVILTGGEAQISAMQFSPSGETIAAASADRLVWLWDTKTGFSHPLKGHLGGVHALTFSPDGQNLASVCDYNTVRLWNISGGAELGTALLAGHTAPVTGIAASSDGRLIFSVDEAGGIWSWNTKEEAGELFTQGTSPLYAVAVSPDQKVLAFAGKDAQINLLTLESKKLETLKGHSDTIRALAFSPDGKTLASGSDDASLLFWDLSKKTSKKVGWFQGAVNSLAFSPDGKLLGIGAAEQYVHMLQLETEQLFQLRVHLDSVSAVAFSPNGKWFASGSLDKRIRVFETAGLFEDEPKPKFSLDGHEARVNMLSFSADETQILSTSDDRTTRLWDLESAQNVVVQSSTTRGLAALYLTKSNRLISNTEQNALIIWQNEDIPKKAEELKSWLSSATTAKVGKDYKLRSNQ